MNGVFQGCSKLSSVDISSFDTSNVYTMVDMFNGCAELNEVDLTNFDMNKIVHINRMFDGCPKLSHHGIKINTDSIRKFERKIPDYYITIVKN